MTSSDRDAIMLTLLPSIINGEGRNLSAWGIVSYCDNIIKQLENFNYFNDEAKV